MSYCQKTCFFGCNPKMEILNAMPAAYIIRIIVSGLPYTNLILKYLKLVLDRGKIIYILNFNKLVYN